MTKQKYSIREKYEMVLMLIKDPSQVQQICKKYNITQSTLYKWRSRFLEGALAELDTYKRGPKPKEECGAKNNEMAKKINEYEKRIAELACENEILKKNENWTEGSLL